MSGGDAHTFAKIMTAAFCWRDFCSGEWLRPSRTQPEGRALNNAPALACFLRFFAAESRKLSGRFAMPVTRWGNWGPILARALQAKNWHNVYAKAKSSLSRQRRIMSRDYAMLAGFRTGNQSGGVRRVQRRTPLSACSHARAPCGLARRIERTPVRVE